MTRFHRLLGLVAALVMLYLGATGTLIQALDLRAMLGHAPEDDPTLLSLNGGRYGGPDYQVLAAVDFRAQALPDDLDYGRAFDTLTQAVNKAASGFALRFVEMRMVRGRPIGQAMLGDKTVAFDLATGASVAAVDVAPPADVPSLRESTKKLHRFWSRPNAWGVWMELASGLLLCGLIISGLMVYFRLLKTHTSLSWISDAALRDLHRGVALVAAIFLVLQPASGTWLALKAFGTISVHSGMAMFRDR